MNKFNLNRIQSKHSYKKTLAFTLAEVLITLGIIGVVAAITIPTLMNNIQDAQLKTAWKKAYSAFSQATLQMANDNGGSLNGYFTGDSDMTSKYGQYMIKSKICSDSFAEGCWSPNTKALNGASNVVVTGPALALNDGSLVEFWLSQSDCMQPIGTPTVLYRCGGAVIDVNGLKNPNVIGKDIFEIHILKDRILPYGVAGDGLNNCNSSGSGSGCSAEFLYK